MAKDNQVVLEEPSQVTPTLNIIFRGLCALVPRNNREGVLHDIIVLMPDAHRVKERSSTKTKNRRFLSHPCFLHVDKDSVQKATIVSDHQIRDQKINPTDPMDDRIKSLWILDNDDITFSFTGGDRVTKDPSYGKIVSIENLYSNLKVDKKLIDLATFDNKLLAARARITKGKIYSQFLSNPSIFPPPPGHGLPVLVQFNTELKVIVSNIDISKPIKISIRDFKKDVFAEITLKKDSLFAEGINHIIISNMPLGNLESAGTGMITDYDFELVYKVRDKSNSIFDPKNPKLPEVSTLTPRPLVCAMASYPDEKV